MKKYELIGDVFLLISRIFVAILGITVLPLWTPLAFGKNLNVFK